MRCYRNQPGRDEHGQQHSRIMDKRERGSPPLRAHPTRGILIRDSTIAEP